MTNKEAVKLIFTKRRIHFQEVFSGYSGFVLAVLASGALLFGVPIIISADSLGNGFLPGDRFENYINNFNFYSQKNNQEEDVVVYTNDRLPENQDRELKYTTNSVLTAYNSEVAQCNDQPCITANGYNLCTSTANNTVAANHLPFGTKLRIPSLFGDRVFVVRDRMNARYSDRIDVWMKEKEDAIHFGIRRAEVEILR